MLWTPSHPLLTPSSSLLLKIPLFVAGTYIAHLAITPPNPPAKTTETAQYGKRTDWLTSSSLTRPLGYMNSTLRWIAVIGESAVVLASNFATPLSNSVLSFLASDRVSAAGIHFTPLRLTGIGLMLAGSLIRLSCHTALGRFFTWELSVKDDQHLVTSGPYSVVRHPSYTAISLIYAGAIMCDFGSGSWYATCGFLDTFAGKTYALALSTWWIYLMAKLMSRTPKEDAVLREKFGKEWEDYAKKTPYRLVPYIY